MLSRSISNKSNQTELVKRAVKEGKRLYNLKKRWSVLLAVCWGSMFNLVVAQPGGYLQKVDPKIEEALHATGTAQVLVLFREQASLSGAAHLPGKLAKGTFVLQQLQEVATRTQAPTRALLKQTGVALHPLFIVNAIYLPRAERALIEALAIRPEIAQLVENGRLVVPEVRQEEVLSARLGTEWGLRKIKAPDVWAMGYTGKGVVIGGQDTGYDWRHPAVVKKYRGWVKDTIANHAYNWHDAIRNISPLNKDSLNPCGLNVAYPCDDNGHGTHTVGTMVGDDGQGNQVGVAPGATWIGCRNMERGYGSPFTYLECFQWFLAPTNLQGEAPNPALAPDVINNSWGCPDIEGCNPTNIPLLEAAVDNLRAAGVFVVVSAGNDGPSCASIAVTPAIFSGGFVVGATNSVDTIARFSSRGPVLYNGKAKLYLKPDVVAPGVTVRSSMPRGSYANLSGTSMAGPHVAGTVALMISANPRLRGEVAQIEQLLKETAYRLATQEACGGFSGDSIPNPTYGNGRINALAAVEAALRVTTSTETTPAAGVLRVFPNPAQDMITLETGLFDGKGQFTLWDISGRLQFQQQVTSWGDPLVSIALPELTPGMYIYRWQTKSAAYSGKLTIQAKD